eukprot:365193-Chlamydomonas_euryale.AAC.12
MASLPEVAHAEVHGPCGVCGMSPAACHAAVETLHVVEESKNMKDTTLAELRVQNRKLGNLNEDLRDVRRSCACALVARVTADLCA